MRVDSVYLETWRQVLRDEFDWKLCFNQEVTKKCWICGKYFHPMKGFETGSHYCSFDCSSKDKTNGITAGITHKDKNGKIRCRWCGKLFKYRKEKHRVVCFCSKHCRKEALIHNGEEIFEKFLNRITEQHYRKRMNDEEDI